MINFLFFNLIFLISSFPALLLFALGIVLCLLPLAPFTIFKKEKPGIVFGILISPFLAVVFLFQVYFWGFWSAFCVAITLRFTTKPSVTWDWLYWISAFMWCVSLIGWLAAKEKQGSGSFSDVQRVQGGTTLYSLIAIGSFLTFAFFPNLVLWPYGWALDLLGLNKYILG